MSDEESFVILGTSPLSSLEHDGDRVDSALDASLHSDTPGSCFSSLKNSQIKELKNASNNGDKTPTTSLTALKETASSDTTSSSMTASKESSKSIVNTKVTSSMSTAAAMQRSADSILWSKPQVEVQDDLLPLNLEDCAIPSPVEQSPKTSMHSRPPPSPLNMSNKENRQPLLSNSNNANSGKAGQATLSASSSNNNSLASSFIMGEVNADILKSSVYSQFPSISMQASAEDVVKLQTMFTEYVQLKTTLEKVNNTMKLFYTNSLEWKEKMNTMESHYKQQLNVCQNQIEALRTENLQLRKSIEEQVEQTKAVDLARQKDRDDMIRTISEKTSLIENMRAQIVKLEKQTTTTFEFLPKQKTDETENNFDEIYISRGEHDIVVKDLNRQLSELLATNLDVKDMVSLWELFTVVVANANLPTNIPFRNRGKLLTPQMSAYRFRLSSR
uniref:Uncharacterized protein n=1 Tax=Stomoxys calcitrans TaxID=35570 RepID=A0A1I8Q7E0_STOCA